MTPTLLAAGSPSRCVLTKGKTQMTIEVSQWPTLDLSPTAGASALEELERALHAGREAFAQKKTASLHAVARAYLVWEGAAPLYASQHARDWLRKALKE